MHRPPSATDWSLRFFRVLCEPFPTSAVNSSLRLLPSTPGTPSTTPAPLQMNSSSRHAPTPQPLATFRQPPVLSEMPLPVPPKLSAALPPAIGPAAVPPSARIPTGIAPDARHNPKSPQFHHP